MKKQQQQAPPPPAPSPENLKSQKVGDQGSLYQILDCFHQIDSIFIQSLPTLPTPFFFSV